MRKRVFASITSTDGEYLAKINEANELGLKEVCLFLTGTPDIDSRKRLYIRLEKSSIEKIPLVHLHSDMESWEIKYLQDRFQATTFCIHSPKEYPIINDWSEFMNLIYYENTIFGFVEEEVKKFAGICLDFTHLDGACGMLVHNYASDVAVINKYPCSCAHIGVIPKNHVSSQVFEKRYHLGHFLQDFSDLDYLKKYPKSFFPAIIALELENSLAEQLKIKEYLEKFLEKS